MPMVTPSPISSPSSKPDTSGEREVVRYFSSATASFCDHTCYKESQELQLPVGSCMSRADLYCHETMKEMTPGTWLVPFATLPRWNRLVRGVFPEGVGSIKQFSQMLPDYNLVSSPHPQFSLETTTKKASLDCQLLQGAVLQASNLADKNHMKGRKEIRYSQTVI